MAAGDFLLIAASFLPGLLYLALVARYDRAVRAPRRYVYGVYALGMFSVVPAALLEMAGGELLFGRLAATPAGMVLTAFFLIGPVEEICKFLAVRSIYESEHFQDPLDGVVYAVAAAMGFASLENAFYVSQLGWEVFWPRAFLAIPGHLVFASFWGYELGRRKFGLGGHVAWGLGLAAFFHGLYDALLMANVLWLGGLVVPLVLVLAWVFRRQMRELRALARGGGTGGVLLGRSAVAVADAAAGPGAAVAAGVGAGVAGGPAVGARVRVGTSSGLAGEATRALRCETCGRVFAVEGEACPACRGVSLALVCSRCQGAVSWRGERCASCGSAFTDRAALCWRCHVPFPPHLPACPLCGAAR